MQVQVNAHTPTRDPRAVLEAYELRKLLSLPDRRTHRGKRAAALLSVLCYGLRIGEAVTITISKVREDQAGGLSIEFRTLKRKDDHWRSVVLDAQAAQHVRDWMAVSGSRHYLFPGRRDHLSVDAAQAVVTPYLRQIRPGLSAHNLRHSAATQIVMETGSIWIAQNLLGHADICVTAKLYAHASLTDARTAANALSAARKRRKPRSQSAKSEMGR